MSKLKPQPFTKAIIQKEAAGLGLTEDDWEILSKDRDLAEIKMNRGISGPLVRGFVWRLGLRYRVGASGAYFNLEDKLANDIRLVVSKAKEPALLK